MWLFFFFKFNFIWLQLQCRIVSSASFLVVHILLDDLVMLGKQHHDFNF